MSRRPLLFIMAVGLSVALLVSLGCSKTGGLMRAVLPSKASPKKRVLVLPVEDKAGLSAGMADKITNDFISILRANSGLVIHEPTTGFSLPGAEKNQLLRASATSLVTRAGEMGMHALVITTVNAVEAVAKKTGLWPFRKSKKEYQLSITADIYDTTTRTLAETKLASGYVRLEIEEGFEHNMNEVMEDLSSEVLPGLVRRQAEAVSRRLSSLPWSCPVTSVGGQGIEIAAGEDLGVREGDFFEVFAEGQEIIAGSGRPVYLIGKRIGFARVVRVLPERSILAPAGKDDLSAARLVYFSP